MGIGQLVRADVGCTSTLAAWLGGAQDDRPMHGLGELTDDLNRVPAPEQIFDYHYALHWLYQHIVPYMTVPLVEKVRKPYQMYEASE